MDKAIKYRDFSEMPADKLRELSLAMSHPKEALKRIHAAKKLNPSK